MNVNIPSDGYYGNSLGHATDGYYQSGRLGSDPDPPVITPISPLPDIDPGLTNGFSSDYATAKATPIVIDVTDTGSGLSFVVVTVNGITAYSGGVFMGPFLASSSSTPIFGGVRLSLMVDGEWTGAPGVITYISVQVTALDASANLAAATLSYRLPPSVALPVVPEEEGSTEAIDHITAAIRRLPEQFRSHDDDVQ